MFANRGGRASSRRPSPNRGWISSKYATQARHQRRPSVSPSASCSARSARSHHQPVATATSETRRRRRLVDARRPLVDQLRVAVGVGAAGGVASFREVLRIAVQWRRVRRAADRPRRPPVGDDAPARDARPGRLRSRSRTSRTSSRSSRAGTAGAVDPDAFVDDLRRLPTLVEWGLSPDGVADRLGAGHVDGGGDRGDLRGVRGRSAASRAGATRRRSTCSICRCSSGSSRRAASST